MAAQTSQNMRGHRWQSATACSSSRGCLHTLQNVMYRYLSRTGSCASGARPSLKGTQFSTLGPLACACRVLTDFDGPSQSTAAVSLARQASTRSICVVAANGGSGEARKGNTLVWRHVRYCRALSAQKHSIHALRQQSNTKRTIASQTINEGIDGF